ncbi:DsbA family protein [Vulgatibacter sp.]|uniref:DsbA family protein n=1 Tax=Vulgatibacter sp. TaxID=1971226 RepID=UPI003565013E
MRLKSFSIALLAALCVSACMREDGNAAPRADEAEQPAAAPPAGAPAAGGTMSLEQAQQALPGFPVENLPPYLRQTLVQVAQDEFVYDGSPYTLAGCLKEDKPCKRHAMRGLTVLANALAGGASATEALTAYGRYYNSFDQKNRKSIELVDAPCLGPADAKVTLVEYADYECPHCAAAAPLLHQVAEQHPDVRLCFQHFPLPTHDNAFSASQAAVYAQRQGKFWELHELIFKNQQRLSPQVIKDLVQQVGLDPQGLVQAVQKDELAPVVEKQRDQGRKLGVMGTPTVFVNGRQYALPLSPELLRFTIEDELEWQSHGGKWANE